MRRTLLTLLILSSFILSSHILSSDVVAQGNRPIRGKQAESNRILAEALRIQAQPPPGMSEEEALDQAFLKMGEALQVWPKNWRAFFHRGVNRCLKAAMNRATLVGTLREMRAAGQSNAEQRRIEGLGLEFIRLVLQDVYRNFHSMLSVMRATGEVDNDIVDFTRAATKYATGEYLEAQGATPGAIDELRKLVQRGWNVELCGNLIGRSYMQLGAAAFGQEKYALAHEYWDNGLKWARSPQLRRTLLTNKAGAFEMDNQFGLAERLLRKQIETESDRPVHWKNLGLVLGYQNHLRTALYAYKRARDLCHNEAGRSPIALLHGNSWLKAAMIHGKLLEADGDLREAWRLFLEYRGMFGDDYNFCFNFGEFCYHMGQYDLAWTFLSRAAEIHPFCPTPYLLLVPVAQRMTGGTPEERKKRRTDAKAALKKVREAYNTRDESAQIRRICGGLRDLGDGGLRTLNATLIDPDPLEGGQPGDPPGWLLKIAEKREAFTPYNPSVEEFLAESASGAEDAAGIAAEEATDEASVEAYIVPGGMLAVIGVALLGLVAAIVVWLVRR